MALEGTIEKMGEEIIKLRGDLAAAEATARAAELAWRDAEFLPDAMQHIQDLILVLLYEGIRGKTRREAMKFLEKVHKVRGSLAPVEKPQKAAGNGGNRHVFVGGYEIDPADPTRCQICDKRYDDQVHGWPA